MWTLASTTTFWTVIENVLIMLMIKMKVKKEFMKPKGMVENDTKNISIDENDKENNNEKDIWTLVSTNFSTLKPPRLESNEYDEQNNQTKDLRRFNGVYIGNLYFWMDIWEIFVLSK